MKLIDFSQDRRLNALRDSMGASLRQFEPTSWTAVDGWELKRRLESLEGIEVEISDIVFSADGTCEYKGRKVLVYIRDQYKNMQQPNQEYKFHIAHCETLARAFGSGRVDRYVVSTRTDGRFLVNVRELHTRVLLKERSIEELHVCKNCLLRLGYKGYVAHSMGRAIYHAFSLEEFFRLYGGTRIEMEPRHTEFSAPPDDYGEEFGALSQTLKESQGWRCAKCGRDLSNHREFLHTHHRNGVKGDNRLENLEALCIRCHADTPGHSHLRNLPQYLKFNATYPS